MLLLFCSIVLTHSVSMATTLGKTTIIGKLVDADNNSPVEYASVALYNQTDASLVTGGLTKADGTFEIEVSKAGTYYLQANFIGYETITIRDITVTGTGGRKNLGILKLSVSRTELDEVVISAKKNHIDYKIDRKVINISTDIAADGGSAADALENVPSVEVDIDGNVTLRGNSNFQVLIDGKPSALDASEILKQTPAAMIENIEIITNPSAKYDPEGETGIINLVTKKNVVQGINGVVNVNAGSEHRYGGDFLFNLRRQKFNYFVGGHYNSRGGSMTGINNRITHSVDELSNDSIDLYNFRTNNHENQFQRGGLKTGFDFYPTDNDIISLAIEGGFSKSEADGSNHYDNWTINKLTDLRFDDEKVNSFTDNGGSSYYYNATLSYQHNFAGQGHKLNFNGFVSRNNNDNDDNFDQYISKSDADTVHKGHHIDNLRDNVRGRLNLDYTLPLPNENRFEAGAQFDFTSSDTDYDWFDLTNGGEFVLNDEFTNEVDFERYITSLYTTYSTHWLGFGIQAGFRFEYTHRLMETPDKDYTINRPDYFPTLHISRAIGENHSVQVGYSRRIRRPWVGMLNPYPAYSDEYSRSMGNPEIEPVYSDALEFNYQITYTKWFFAVETFYRHTDGQMQNVSRVGENNILISRPENLCTNNDFGAGLTLNIDPCKWFTSNTDVEMRQYYTRGNYEGKDLSRDGKSWRLRQQFTFAPAKNTKIQLNMRYRGANKSLISSNKGTFITGLSVRQSFLNKRVSVSLNVRDIFKTQNMKSTTDTETFWEYSERHRKAPSWNIGVNFKINNFKEKLPDEGEGGGTGGGGDDFGGGMDF